MTTFTIGKSLPIQDFRQAHRQASLQHVLARVTGKSVELLSYEDVLNKLRMTGRSERGMREIPIANIVGTVGRCTDFTRSFLPRQGSDEQRWASLMSFVRQNSLDALPPIEVYQIGSAYFVQDGHHRVSIARQLGIEFIAAVVTEIHTRVPLTPDADWNALIRNAEYAAFLEYTHLDRLRPRTDFSVSVPGQYARLEDHIEVHRYFVEAAEDRDLDFEEAVCRWHDEAYLPIAAAIHDQGLLSDFPDRTTADFYLWIAEQRLVLQRELGWAVSAEAATASLAEHFGTRSRPLLDRTGRAILSAMTPIGFKTGPTVGQWRKTRLAARYSDHLFADILVPIGDTPATWAVLNQALAVARLEGGRVHGLHIVADAIGLSSAPHEALRQEFDQRCAAAAVEGSFNLEVGALADKVRELAALTDLVVMGLGPQGRTLSAEVRTWMRQCSRPVLAVPETVSAFQHALLAYDGSPKSKEALFVAAYLGERWRARLTVITVDDPGRGDEAELAYAHRYLELHELTADFVQVTGNVPEAILRTVKDRACDALLMGSYTYAPVVEAVRGTAVNWLLRDSPVPVLVCR